MIMMITIMSDYGDNVDDVNVAKETSEAKGEEEVGRMGEEVRQQLSVVVVGLLFIPESDVEGD